LSWLNDWAHSTSGFGKISFALVIAAAFLGVIGLLLLLVDRAPKRGREKWQAFLFLLPALLLVLIGLVVPIFSTALSSFTDTHGNFTGENFSWAFGDNQVRHAIANTLRWVVLAPILATTIGLAYAYAIDGVKGEALAKSLVFLPTAISFVGAAVIWNLMYKQPSFNAPAGLVNVVLNWVGLGPLGFPTNQKTITYLLIVIMIWIQAGFATVVLSAAIKGVPTELSEAAKIDGATEWQAFRRVTIPSIRPSLIVVMVTISVATLKVFDLVQAFGAQQFGGDVLANKMYVTYQQAGIGTIGEHQSSALAMIIFVLVIPFVIFQVRNMVKSRVSR